MLLVYAKHPDPSPIFDYKGYPHQKMMTLSGDLILALCVDPFHDPRFISLTFLKIHHDHSLVIVVLCGQYSFTQILMYTHITLALMYGLHMIGSLIRCTADSSGNV